MSHDPPPPPPPPPPIPGWGAHQQHQSPPPPPPPPAAAAAGDRPPSYMGLAVGALLVFWPTGIAAMVHAAQVDSAWENGRGDEARRRSHEARRWSMISFVIMGLSWAFVGLVLMAYAASSPG
ncbi:MAG: CD225/dispanin family protein [Acidimicrobiales bacterium]|nr:CD225/dispanin family protein [Acidimicrobiales bacterium]